MGCVSSKKGSLDITTDAAGQGDGKDKPVTRERYFASHAGRANTAARGVEEPPPQPKPEECKTEEEKQVLKVAEVDFNIQENVVNHNTDKYEITQEREEDDDGSKPAPQLVVRRGEPFDISVTFDRPFDKTKDDIKLVFDCGSNPLESKGTRITLMLSDVDKPRQWGAKTVSTEGNTIKMRIFTPPNCIVAKWNFKFDSVVKLDDKCKVFRYQHTHPVYILFNPWCPDDTVFLDDVQSRNEYVLNDHGYVYRGNTKQISRKPWNFGQFEDFMLDCVLYLLDNSGLSYHVRGNPVFICRKISAMANSEDDCGVLTGNWSGNYAGGTSPLKWVGSVAIMEQYWKTLKAVSFGQCWVFSGVVATICRCLGLPCRSITNFASAHDSDGSITIDRHWTWDGKPMEEFNADSVWNFHVWNEAWMARSDLPSGFGGWQAFDATPQETSDGVYCAGPCSVEALRNGLVQLPYDGPFIFAEVNADRVNWIQLPEGGWNNSKQTHSVGKFLSTKSVGDEARQDITRQYKFPEGSQQERTAVWRAAKEGSSRQDVYEVKIKDMRFDLVDREDVLFGEPFVVAVKINNDSEADRSVKLTLTATNVYYTGVPVKEVKSESYVVNTKAGAAGEVKMNVTVDDYLEKIADMCHIKISVMARVEETKQFYCESDDFRLCKPDLAVKVPEQVTVGEEYEVEISFTNPLKMSLTKCEFTVEGAGLQRPKELKHESIGPHGEGKVTAKLKAKRPGLRKIIASFDSKELGDLSGEANLTVVAPSQTQTDQVPS